jgi:TolB-like protein/Flp pilus assembly protein TadD/predicted Ser/Thr protein kinase
MVQICPKCRTENDPHARTCSSCGLQLDIADDLPISRMETQAIAIEELKRGTTFAGRYQVIEELGQGGMGKVYRVEDSKTNEELALKLIKPEIASDKTTIERFINELKIAHKISHRNVCSMYHLGEDQGNYYITMEYVPGEDLKSVIGMTRSLSLETVVAIGKQICYGLAEAHRLGVVHRDLKPSNIMVDREGNVRIMDFGIARSFRDKGITGAGMMIGTPEYMSPEQVQSKEVDQRTDIYSLGVILFEMVTGRPPFSGNTPLSVAVKHQTEIPPDPRDINAHLPEELSRLILRCMKKDKDERYQNADEILDELNRIGQEMSTLQKPATDDIIGTLRKSPWATNKKWWIPAVLILAAVFVGIYLVFSLLQKPSVSEDRKMLVVLPFENLGTADDEYFAAGITEEITSRLAALHGLSVISRTSAIQYNNTNKTIRQIAEELDVDYVLDGSVRWNRGEGGSGRVRITPQLIRVRDDTQVWSERYDRVIEDIFVVQNEIAEQVAQNLDLTVLEPERRTLNTRPTDNLDAYVYFLKAREHEDRGWASQDLAEFEVAIDLLDRATELDPEFVPAYARKTYIHSRMYFFGDDRTEQRLAKAREAVNKAVEVAPDLPEAKWALGFYYYWCLFDYNRAAETFEDVLRARPNFDPQLLGYIQRRQGKWEQCVETLERAFRINPLDMQIAYELGGANISLHRFAEAETWFQRTLELSPQHLPALLGKVAILILSNGDTQKAISLLASLPEHQLKDHMWFTLNMLERNFSQVLEWLAALPYESYEDQHFYFQKNLALAAVYFALGDTSRMREQAEAARLILEPKVSERPEDPRFHASLGLVYAYLGRKDSALREGNQAASLHPVSRDAAQGPIYLLNLSKIYTLLGDSDEAIDQLTYLLSIPQAEFLWHLISVPQLRLDPQWDSLRENPRFQRLLTQ